MQPMPYKTFDPFCMFLVIRPCRFNLVNLSENIHHLADRVARLDSQEPKPGTKRERTATSAVST